MAMRIAATIAALILAFAFAGCSSAPQPSASPSASGSASSDAHAADAPASEADNQSSATSLFTNDGWPQDEITADVPVPEFSVNPDGITTSGAMVIVNYKAVPEDEVAAFVDEVKDAGFTYSASESKSSSSYSYSARNAEDPGRTTSFSLTYSQTGDLHISVTKFDFT